MRYRVTTVLLKARRGSEQYQSMNSRMAWSYDRWELWDVRLFRTADFDCSRSGSFKTVWDFVCVCSWPFQDSVGQHGQWHSAPCWRVYRYQSSGSVRMARHSPGMHCKFTERRLGLA